ncbi:MAG: DNA topoisomerase I [Gammaproteobacteria bacterium]
MAQALLVVESPAKASTIKKYLGSDFDVLASYGHVRDLRPKEGAVEVGNGFKMVYEPIDRNVKHVEAIARSMKKAKALYLATDLDREGEAISWHLVELLNEKKAIGRKPVYRVVFHEITKQAIHEAMEHPREIAMDLVNAQQARRALDYLVGFNLSPLLWKKIRRGLSAGRVQSPALRMIVERELEIEAFKPQEYWTIAARARLDSAPVEAKLALFRGEKIKQFTFTGQAGAHEARDELIDKAAGTLVVTAVEKKQRKRNPAPPFITSTLQQEAIRKLGFTAQRTMRVAQQLYEGVDIGSESIGLITYMRTDSTNLAQEAVDSIRRYVAGRYGASEVPARPRVYKTAAKNAQEAHEAIRPTAVDRSPESIRKHLSAEQLKLYDLIWKRTVACQMNHATIDTVAVDLACSKSQMHAFRANGSTVTDPGFMAVYQEGADEVAAEADERMLPAMKVGDRLALDGVDAEQHFTEPPPRYTEASLVKSLEEYGIGRPSTYASIIQTLLQREYVELDNKRFRPTDIGRIVIRFLTEHFGTYVDYEFTARMEDELDSISRGEKDWVPVMEDFWRPFADRVQDKEQSVSRRDVAQARDLGHDASGKPVSVRMGRFGPFVQVGSAEGEIKPRFYSLRPGQRLDTITLEEALALTRLPRDLGTSPEGESIVVNIGRFGPYVRYGSKFVSLKKEDDPYTIELPRALELVEEKKKADAARNIKSFEGTTLRILNGRFGPYITDGTRNARVPKDSDPAGISLEQAQELIAKAPEPRRGRRPRTVRKTA